MRKTIELKTLILSMLFVLNTTFLLSQQTVLNLEFTNLLPSTGKIHIGIYNSANGFPEVDRTYWNKIDQVSSDTYTLNIEELPPGEYCVSVFHDKNGNDKFDFNFIGLPLETYGFSKNIYHIFRASTFEECAFQLNDSKSFTIKLVK